MRSNSRAARRALLFLLMVSALGAPKAQAQYFTSQPVDAWRTATGQAAPAPISKIPLASTSQSDALSKENLENMSQASAVRIGCGVSSADSLATLSIGFTEVVGIAWGMAILGIGLFSLRGRKGAVSKIARGGAILGFAAATPTVANATISFLSASSAGMDDFVKLALTLVAVASSMLGVVVLTSPDKFGTMKRLGKLCLSITAVFTLGLGWMWANSAIENARSESARSQTAPAYATPARPASATVMPVGTLH